jgi:hypothetical protein
MNNPTRTRPPAASPVTSPLPTFFERMLQRNPFLANRVLQPATLEADAPAVHHGQFLGLVELAETAQTQQLGVGAVLWGEAGVGKSHLLGRLARWAATNRRAHFTYLHNLQARAAGLPRYVLNCVVSGLTLGRTTNLFETPLVRLVNGVAKVALQGHRGTPSWSDLEAAFHRQVGELLAQDPTRAALVDRTIYQVFLRLLQSVYLALRSGIDDGVARLAILWLAGEPLDAAEAQQLHLRPMTAGSALRDDQHVKQVLVALAHLALCRQQPLLLCFDQVDNLEPEQVAALSRFLQALLDSAPNLVVVTSGVKEVLLRFHDDRVIQDSAWDRLAQFEIDLHRIDAADASRLVQARLERFVEPFLDQVGIKDRVQQDHLFPLGTAWFESAFKDKKDIRPRDVISRAREAWQREQEALRRLGAPEWLRTWGSRKPEPPKIIDPVALPDRIDRKVEQRIEELKDFRERQQDTLPPAAENLAGLVYQLLQQYRRAMAVDPFLEVEQLQLPKSGRRLPFLMVRQRHDPAGSEIRTGLLFVVTPSKWTATAALRQLMSDPDAPDRLLLVTDERWRLQLGARGQELLHQLQQRLGANLRQIEVAISHYAGLDALQAVVGMARSGDLEIEWPGSQTRKLTEQEVIESHYRRQRYHAYSPLRQLLAAEQVEASPTADRSPPLPEDREVRQFIMGQLALHAGLSSQKLAEAYLSSAQGATSGTAELIRWQAHLESIARRMQHQGLIEVSDRDGGQVFRLRQA